ncbi:SphA family protein [Zobellella maritima]|uniref:SphA family protein n=1 Tax=Zobellella maritima TaxID=2059725 RepID=UPI000E30A3AC|nr:transporter [Zobellella maritima]
MNNRPTHQSNLLSGMALTAALTLSAGVAATEGGGSIYPMGAENFGMGALPPAGVYPLLYASRYSADRLNDANGDALPVDFKLQANVIAPRLLWVTEQQLLGGQLFSALLLPLVDLDVTVNGTNQRKRGLGDIDLTLGVAYHHSTKLHTAFSIDVFAPTGRYHPNDLANIGRNYWTVQPVYAASYLDPHGVNADIKLMYDYNFDNPDTDYRSGQEFHFDYALGYSLTPNWIAGIGGYGYKQLTDDERHGITIANNRGQAFAIGPSVKYDSGKGGSVNLKYQHEFAVENRPEGSAFWVKAVIPL